jgi:hypothetical protein
MIVGSILVIGGLLMVANGTIAGPHAFAGGQRTVLWLVSTRVVVFIVGVWELVRANAR